MAAWSTMPHSYDASLAFVLRWGASSREAMMLTSTNSTASTPRTNTGRYSAKPLFMRWTPSARR